MATASTGQQVTDSLNGKLTFEQDKNRIVGRDEDNIIRMLILADGGEFRMRISEEGVDVLTATPDQIVFDTGNRLFKIVDSGTVDLLATSGSSDIEPILHHQLEQPTVFAFANNIGISGGGGLIAGNTILPWYNLILSGSVFVINAAITFTVSPTEIIFTLLNRYGSTIGTTVRYYIVQETSAP